MHLEYAYFFGSDQIIHKRTIRLVITNSLFVFLQIIFVLMIDLQVRNDIVGHKKRKEVMDVSGSAALYKNVINSLQNV